MRTNDGFHEHMTGGYTETALAAINASYQTMLPAQWYPNPPQTGEKRLLLAILTDGLNCYLTHGPEAPTAKQRRLYEDARCWIFDPPATRHAFCFDDVCDALNINAEKLRANLAGMAGRKLPRRSVVVANVG